MNHLLTPLTVQAAHLLTPLTHHLLTPLTQIKKVKKEENGIVPVLTDDVRVYYDSHDHVYFAVIKVEGKKIRLEMSRE